MNELQQNTKLYNGKYKIQSTIGQGGFGITYLAKMKKQGTMTLDVAIKEFFIKSEHYRDKNGKTVCCSENKDKQNDINFWKTKFEKECDLLLTIEDDRIVKVIERFAENDTVYYSMEYIEGCNLYHTVKEGGYSEQDAIFLIIKIAEALNVLHKNKIVHLDLNPKNIMVRKNGEIVLIDFGLSKVYDKNDVVQSSVNIGAHYPGFAPIEQTIFKKGFTATLDIYALGANFYRLLTGENPPEAEVILAEGFDSLEQKLKNIGISKNIVNIVKKTLEPSPKDRFQTVDEFINALPKAKSEKVIIIETDEKSNRDTIIVKNDQIQESEPKEDTNSQKEETDKASSRVTIPNPEVMYEKGIEYFNKKKYKEAFDNFSISALKGFSKSYYYLGLFFENGYYVDCNPKNALLHYKIAAAAGVPGAKEKYKKLRNKNRIKYPCLVLGILLVIFSIYWIKGYTDAKEDSYRYNNHVNTIENVIKDLNDDTKDAEKLVNEYKDAKNDMYILKYLYEKHRTFLSSVYKYDDYYYYSNLENAYKNFVDKNPIIIKDIEFCSTNENGQILRNYGEDLYASNTQFLQTRLRIISLVDNKKITLECHVHYSNKNKTIYVETDLNNYTTEISGGRYGSEYGNIYMNVRYVRWEFFYKGKKLYQKTINLY